MPSRMKRTSTRRRNKTAAVGGGRKRELRKTGTTPKFAVHPEKK